MTPMMRGSSGEKKHKPRQLEKEPLRARQFESLRVHNDDDIGKQRYPAKNQAMAEQCYKRYQ